MALSISKGMSVLCTLQRAGEFQSCPKSGGGPLTGDHCQLGWADHGGVGRLSRSTRPRSMECQVGRGKRSIFLHGHVVAGFCRECSGGGTCTGTRGDAR